MARPARRERPSSERKIFFYRAQAGRTEGGEPVRLDFEPILDEVEGLPCAIGGRYWEQPDGNVVCAWIDSDARRQRFRLATVRRSGLPLLEQEGNLSPLNVPATAGLYEAIHAVVFPDNVVGVEFNFYGPRPSRIPTYLMHISRDTSPTFTLDPLMRQDVLDQLRDLRRLRVFDFKVRTSYAETVAQANRSLGRALRACEEVGRSQVVHLVLQPEPYDRSWLEANVLRATRALARRRDLRENALRLSVSGESDEPGLDTIDVLRDELVSAKRIVRVDQRSRAVDDTATYAAIEEAYAELRDQLEAAAAVEQ